MAVEIKELNVGIANWWNSFPGSPPLDVEAGLRLRQREGRMNDPVFLKACSLASIEVTPRQARKWNNGRGKALGFRNQAKSQL
jgi:hypothetical protein